MNIENDDTKTEKMKAAYNLGSMLVRDRLAKEDEENIKILEEMDKSDVIVVRGTYDHIHLVLELSNLPFLEVSQEELLQLELRPDQTVFVNCANNFPARAARKLATFVASGGQLISTDWALSNVIEVAFPNTIAYNNKPTLDEVVRIEIVDREDPILKGFLDEESNPVWWLEGSSYPIKILDKENVRVLVRSKELKEKYGEGAVIVSFTHGQGIVYHMISHFYLQRTETRDKRQEASSIEYSMAKGASKKTMSAFMEMEEAMPDIDYGTVQSATTSAEFINRALIKQKKKYKEK